MFIVLMSFRLKSKDLSEAMLGRTERLVLAMVYLAGIATGGLAILYATSYEHRWGVLLAFLPYILIMQHATFLRIVRQPALKPLRVGAQERSAGTPDDTSGIPAEDEDPQPVIEADGDDAEASWWRSVLESAKATTDRYFGPVSLAVRYGTAAMAVLLVGLTAFLVLFVDDQILRSLIPGDQVHYVHAAKLGLAGAYVYVLIHLGRRNFTHDVTSGGAVWCSIVLAVGPILAAILSYLLDTSDGTKNPVPETFGINLIYFIAGFSPRVIISFMENVANKAWGPSSVARVTSPRTVPITQAAGVTQEVADRLVEEGILDLHGLAMADPLRLIRNTNFDRREIVSWIDEAILIDMFPDHWKAFEHEGINGAIDLVSLVYPPPYRQYGADDEATMKQAREDYLKILCTHLKLSEKPDDDVKKIHSIARALVNDAQVRLIWVLHNHIADDSAAPQLRGEARVAHA